MNPEPEPWHANATATERGSTFGRFRAVSGGLSGFALISLTLPIVTVTSCGDGGFNSAATQANGFDLLSGFDASTPGATSGAITHVPGTWLIALTALILLAAVVICVWRSRLAPLGAGVLSATAFVALLATVRHLDATLGAINPGANRRIVVGSTVHYGLGVQLLIVINVLIGIATAVRVAAARWRRRLPGYARTTVE